MAGAWKMLLVLFIIASPSLSQESAGGDPEAAVGWMMSTVRSGCRGSIGECLSNEDEEFELDSESNRRILASRPSISYDALRRDNVPCSRRGGSYYNCRPGADANPYRRGCSAIARCRS